MITIKPATRESRPRDRKRFRAVLKIGNTTAVHLTLDELAGLLADGRKTYAILSSRKDWADLERRKGGGR